MKREESMKKWCNENALSIERYIQQLRQVKNSVQKHFKRVFRGYSVGRIHNFEIGWSLDDQSKRSRVLTNLYG